jgi:hypothetical protein
MKIKLDVKHEPCKHDSPGIWQESKLKLTVKAEKELEKAIKKEVMANGNSD